MLDKFNGENLQVGDKVIVCRSVYWGSSTRRIGEIVKRTPTGLLDVKYGNGVVGRFRPNGDSYNKTDRYITSTLFLENYSEEQAKEIQQTKHRALMLAHLSKVDWSKYTNEELESIVKHISSLRSS